jgi:hypothetical protein
MYVKKKKLKRKRKTKVKFYTYKGLKCQGRKELKYLKECERYKRALPTKAERIKTPLSFYTPDFEYTDKYVEIKSLGTFKVCLGLEAYKGIGVPSNKQWEKIKWVAKYVKPVEIIVYLTRRDKIPIIDISEEGVTIKLKGGYKSKTQNIIITQTKQTK